MLWKKKISFFSCFGKYTRKVFFKFSFTLLFYDYYYVHKFSKYAYLKAYGIIQEICFKIKLIHIVLIYVGTLLIVKNQSSVCFYGKVA